MTLQQYVYDDSTTVRYCVYIHAPKLQVAEPLLPYALAFAAGAMVYVVVDDLVPEAHQWSV